MEMTHVEYKCKQCGATDYSDFFENEPPFPALNCWKCKAGMKLSYDEQASRGMGMFPTSKSVYDTNAR